MSLLSSGYFEIDKNSSVRSRTYAKFFENETFQKIIETTIHSDEAEMKYQVLRKVALERLIEQELRNCFEYFFPNRHQGVQYLFQYPSNRRMSDLDFMLGTNQDFIGMNLIGKAMSPAVNIWQEENATFLYYGYHVIEYLTQYYLESTDFSKYYNKNIFEIVYELKIWSPKWTDHLKWFKNFNDKEWIYSYLLEEEHKSPGSICFFIQKWLSPLRKSFSKTAIVKQMFPVMAEKIGSFDERIMLQDGVYSTVMNKYLSPSFSISKEVKKELTKIEFNELTSLEIETHRNFFPYQYKKENTQIIQYQDSMSPFSNRVFKIGTFEFTSIMEYVFFLCARRFTVSNKEAYDAIKNSIHFEKCLEELIQEFLEKKFYLEMFEKLENIEVNYSIIDALIEHEKVKVYFEENFPAEATFWTERALQIEKLCEDKEYRFETVHFTLCLAKFFEFWDDEFIENNDMVLLQFFVWLFYPGLGNILSIKKKTMKDLVEINDEVMEIFFHFCSETIASCCISLFSEMKNIQNPPKGTETFQFIRKLNSNFHEYIIIHLDEWKKLIYFITKNQRRKVPTLFSQSCFKGKDLKANFVCKTLSSYMV